MYTMLIVWIIGVTSHAVQGDGFLKQQRYDVRVSVILDLKSDAYEILKTKCNGCHRTKNPAKVFTVDNMDRFSAEIYKQVFVKKRMPKGRENQLTLEEYERLKKWLSQNK